MKPDTPLNEVAGLLPADAASHLLNFSWDVQEAVLGQVRTIMVFWEENGYELDPIAYEGVLCAFVPTLAPMWVNALQRRQENANLNSRLAGAELLIRILNKRIAQLEGMQP